MKKIRLTNGKYTLVDDEDFEYLNKWNWYADEIGNTTYVKRKQKIEGKVLTFYMHRVIMNPRKGKLVDHKNRNGLDNQKHNLRECNKGQNQINQRSQKNSSSKYLGVHWDKSRGKWSANCCKDYKHNHCGRFNSEIDAAKAYNKKALELHGEFANLNPV